MTDKNKMHVCILASSFPRYDGDFAGFFIYEQAKRLVEKGNKITVVAPHDFKTVGYEVRDGIYIHRFQYAFPRKYQKIAYHGGVEFNLRKSLIAKLELPFFLLSFFIKSLKVCANCDIIHAHWIPAGLITVFLKRIYKKPSILTVHGADVCDIKEDEFPEKDNMPFNRLLKKFSLYVLKDADNITSVTGILKDRLVRLGVDEDKIHVIPNGIDIHKFKLMEKEGVRKKIGSPLDRKIILFVGSVVERKGVDYLFDAITEVIGKDKSALFVFVGDGCLKKELIYKAEKQGIKNHVNFVGQKPRNDIPLWMNSADIFILPSLSEGRPNAVLEAMACGLPVVATNVSGTPEIVKDGKTGFLIQPKNSDDIVEKILKLLKDEQLRHFMGTNGLQIIEKEGLTWESNTSRFIKLYEKMLPDR